MLFAFLMALLAGLSTGIGSLIAFFTRKTNKSLLSFALGFSAGVMIFISMIELYPEAKRSLMLSMSEKNASWVTAGAFFCGMLLIGIIDKLIPSAENPHEIHSENTGPSKELLRVGILTALAIAVHNFPEGLAAFVSALRERPVGISIAAAVAIHNIPEGIAVSILIYYATGSRKKAFVYSALSGLSEPVGALVGYVILRNIITDVMFGVVFAAVAGIMVFISLDELLPASREYGEHHLSIYGLVAGMAVMAASLVLFM
jgi:ZIP family zinc transporter